MLNFLSLIFTRQCIAVSIYPSKLGTYQIGRNEFVAFAALTKNYTLACDENPQIQQHIAKVGHENVTPAFINSCLPLEKIVVRTGYALADLGHVNAAKELLLPQVPTRETGGLPLIKRTPTVS